MSIRLHGVGLTETTAGPEKYHGQKIKSHEGELCRNYLRPNAKDHFWLVLSANDMGAKSTTELVVFMVGKHPRRLIVDH
jgi:hypothetical protein